MEYNYYLVMAYAMAVVAIVAEIMALRIGRRRALKHVEEERSLEAQE